MTEGRYGKPSFRTRRTAMAVVFAALLAPAAAQAGKLTCLTGTDPSVANDAYQLALVRAAIGVGFTNCKCADFDGSPGKTNAAYLKCIKGDVDLYIQGGNLRPQCKQTLLKQLKQTTCGVAPSTDPVPCVKKALSSGKVTCAIKARAQCVDKPGKFTQLSCVSPSYLSSCADTADTNNDGLISPADSGACALPWFCGNGVREGFEQCDPPGSACANGNVCGDSCYCTAPTETPTLTPNAGQPTNTPAPPPPPTNTPVPAPTNTPPPPGSTATRTFTPAPPTNTPTITPTPTITQTPTPQPRFVDNGNGTITDNQTGLMWHKLDDSGNIEDKDGIYHWAGTCSVSGAYCQPESLSAAACAAETGGALGCAQCGAGEGTCTLNGYGTIWEWLVFMNTGAFGHTDWRIPTVSELQTIVDTGAPGCGSGSPCVPAVFNTNCTPGCFYTGCSCTVPNYYWSASTYPSVPGGAWIVYFFNGGFYADFKGSSYYVRAVRGGS